MKALRLHGPRALRVDSIDEPGNLAPTQLLLRNRFCGICGTDLHEYEKPQLVTAEPHRLTGTSFPQILGHEFSAEVVAVGSHVTSASVGARVAVMPLLFCGQCTPCLTGRQECCSQLGAVGYNWPWGGMAEYSIVENHQVAVLPEDMTDQQGALVEPTAVAMHAVRSGPVRAGDNVLVTGGGPIGQLVALNALAAGAGAVFLSEPNHHRRAHAETLGLTGVFDPTSTDVPAELRESFPDGMDFGLECAGNRPALEACLAAVGPGGTVVQTALHPRPVEINANGMTLRDITLKGVNCFPITSWPRIIRLISSGRLPVEKIVTGEIALSSAIDDGFEMLRDPAASHVKVLIAS